MPELPRQPIPVLAGRWVVLRPWTADDLERLDVILAEPSVALWWGTQPPVTAARYWVADDGDETTTFVIERDGAVIGSIQYSEEEEPDYRSAGIDLFLTNAAQGLGNGPDAIRTLARYLFTGRGHHRLTIDPAAANTRAITAYRKVGFREIGIARNYERGADGAWHDGLLMDMLADELT